MTHLPIARQGTITIAPEVATEELQKVINKAIPRERLYHVFEEALKRDILNLRLYFLIGVPTKHPKMWQQLRKWRKRCAQFYCRMLNEQGRWSYQFTISPMVPKPHTPFQWVPMEPPKTIAKKLDYLKREINSLGSIKVSSASAAHGTSRSSFCTRATEDSESYFGNCPWHIMEQCFS